MAKVILSDGITHTFNVGHVLSLRKGDEIVNITIEEYLKQTDEWKSDAYWRRTGAIRFDDGYKEGALPRFGSKSSRRRTLKKHIKACCEYRLGVDCYKFKHDSLEESNDIISIAHSLGQFAERTNGTTMFSMNHDFAENCMTFEVELLGEDDYYGFSLDGDNLYVMGDYSVTHNTVSGCQITGNAIMNGIDVIYVTTEVPSNEIVGRIIAGICRLPSGDLQDFTSKDGMIGYAASKGPQMGARVNKVFDMIAKHLRIEKVSVEDSLDPKTMLESKYQRFKELKGRDAKLVIFDWIGRSGDAGESNSSAERAAAWERAADRVVMFTEANPCATFTFAQAVNNSAMFSYLTVNELATSKALGRQMTAVVGITNTADKALLKSGEVPSKCALDEQYLCLAKSRKSEGTTVKVRRDFKYQRFVEVRET